MPGPETRRDPPATATPTTSAGVRVTRWRDGCTESASDVVAEEAPVALRYQGTPYVVMMTTPADLEDLAVGFTLSEGLVAEAAEIRGVRTISEAGALAIDIDIAAPRFAQLLQRQRNLSARTGCGLCGAETLEGAIRQLAPITTPLAVSAPALHAALAELAARQPLNQPTGSVHAAAWVLPDGGIQLVREDVGRHNALDKLIGALVRAGRDIARGYVIITSRASYEMVQKAATVCVPLLVAVSAPTAFAIRLAENCGMTLAGFARPGQHVIYAHPERLPG
ncbi:MAG: formate dehydrogenase accessory sulfurtransferase FdhD [Gammaproteobacteria bacterium]|nr:formate dehydrogenase accessory sulfurtransferase FdhD [Gammaproteobacteria bacterium]